ncbi:hypothetical protein V6N11_001628 [Hibiscus sabdariffa]|uniref:RNase H type-1 domain-containing protein n=2 Tax=Hibiscus sabdariffa TaxID=183260 RepID=A0ABR2NKE6_9ROSI
MEGVGPGIFQFVGIFLTGSLYSGMLFFSCYPNSSREIFIVIGFVGLEAPPLGYLKLNVDGAMLRDGSKGGIGGFLRNIEGRCIASFYGSVGQGCPILIELLAVKYGLDNFLGLSVDSNMRLIMECDSKVAVDWILNPERCQSLFLSLVHNIQSLLLRCRAFLKHIPRGANIEVDILAKKGIG